MCLTVAVLFGAVLFVGEWSRCKFIYLMLFCLLGMGGIVAIFLKIKIIL